MDFQFYTYILSTMTGNFRGHEQRLRKRRNVWHSYFNEALVTGTLF
jgi:hypothetical protein